MLRLAEEREREAELEEPVRHISIALRERLRVLGHVLGLGLEVRDVRELRLQNFVLGRLGHVRRLRRLHRGAQRGDAALEPGADARRERAVPGHLSLPTGLVELFLDFRLGLGIQQTRVVGLEKRLEVVRLRELLVLRRLL